MGVHLACAINFAHFGQLDEFGPVTNRVVGPFAPSTNARAHQNQRTDSFRVLERVVDCGRATHRAPDECCFLDAKMDEQVVQVSAQRVGTVGHLGFAKTAMVVTDHAKFAREGLELAIPHPAVCDAGVDENERGSASYGLEVNLRLIGNDVSVSRFG